MIQFGTGGWRAVIADGFTRANIRLVAAGLAQQMLAEGHAGGRVCLGYDRRFLSKEAMHWAAEVLAGYGLRPYVIHRSAPTPLIMYTTRQMDCPYGLAVTASHNPAIYNGIKIFTRGGRDAAPEVTLALEERINATAPQDIPCVDYAEALAGGLIEEGWPVNAYLDSILALIDLEAIKRAQLHIALDPMYGVGQSCLRTLLAICRCDVEVIHDQHDTLFGGRMPAPSADALGLLANTLAEKHCALGIATDGDADRLGVLDEQGRYLHPNSLLVLLYYYLLHYRGWRGDCVRNNSTTHLLDRVAAQHGQTCHEVPVGFKYISAKMEQTGAILGGESSGGLAVRGHIAGKDGIYAAALLVEMLAVTGKSVSELYREICAQYGRLYYAEAAFATTPARKAQLQALMQTDSPLPCFGPRVLRVDRTDGCKVWLEGGGWVICRFSGTEPLLRMAAESPAPQDAPRWLCLWQQFLAL